MNQVIRNLPKTDRISALKQSMLAEQRFVSIEQAKIITEVYRAMPKATTVIKRAHAFKAACERLSIRIDAGELIVGNRTAGVRAGVVSPESGLAWIDQEIETMATRPQDKFSVHAKDIKAFREEIFPYWKGHALEDQIKQALSDELATLEPVAKINQKDHAQGHICPNTETWLTKGPRGLIEDIRVQAQQTKTQEQREFLEATELVLEGAIRFIERYAELAEVLAKDATGTDKTTYERVAQICFNLTKQPAETFHEAVQATWFLFALLQLESNASSFSPGRMDQYLYPYFQKEYKAGTLSLEDALEILEAMWLKFNQIVYLRNSNSARYFAGFPIGFNVALGGQHADGRDATNELSYLFLKAQEHIGLPQPNLSARLHAQSPHELILECTRVIGKGSGMPQIFNDEAVIPALIAKGIEKEDAIDYAIVGCVELTTQGNSLGWSDAAMFNLVKALELTLNDGVCLLSGRQLGLKTGTLATYRSYEEFEEAYAKQMYHFMDRMIVACEYVEKMHASVLPSPFLSSVIDGCITNSIDVTAGGAKYNLSGIQAVQVANVADSLAVVRHYFAEKSPLERTELLEALRTNFAGKETLRNTLIHKHPKYGNDIPSVDEIGNKWVQVFDDYLKGFTNVRGGIYHTGLYTVSAHVPMGQNVGATPDGRRSQEPLADGGMSAVYGRDTHGPTALLKSVSRIDSMRGSNGTLLNMKFLPQMFATEEGLNTFTHFLKAFIALKIIHIQFNVLKKEDLLAAQENPEQFKTLTVRVAGYTAYFTELAADLQDEIIARTSYGEL